MALVFEGSTCVICGEKLDLNPPIFATSGLFPVPGPLLKYCDTPMHWDCYVDWPHRKVFAAAYVLMWVSIEGQTPYWSKVWLDEQAFVTVNPHEPTAEVSVRLFATGSDFRVKLSDWEAWLNRPDDRLGDCLVKDTVGEFQTHEVYGIASQRGSLNLKALTITSRIRQQYPLLNNPRRA